MNEDSSTPIEEKEMDILCVIDVQPGYAPSLEHVHKVIREIQRAGKNGAFIAIVEMDYSSIGRTERTVLESIHGFQNGIFFKQNQDGSDSILNGLKNKNIIPRKIEIVGLYTSDCVLSTVIGLRQKLSPERVDVLPEATFPTLWKETLICDEKLRQVPKQESPSERKEEVLA